MRTLSWILLLVATALIALIGVGSVGIAYFAPASNDVITGSTSLGDLSLDDATATALRGRRGTAAACALGFAALLCFVVVGPYRKGAVWAWWAILCSTVILAGTILLRIPALDTTQGATTGGLLLGVVAIALILDIRRLMGSRVES
jgi:hypothetical protein